MPLARRGSVSSASSPTFPDPAPALRVGCAPVLLLAWELGSGTPLPFLAPIFATILLSLSPFRPQLPILMRLFAVVIGVTLVLTQVFATLADAPAAVWLGLLALATACFAQLARTPQNLAATVALIVASIVTVLLQVSAELPPILPWLMGRAFVLGAAAALLAHVVLPGRPTPAGAPPSPPGPRPGEGWRAVGKALAWLAALGACVALNDTSAILIATTVTNVLRVPDVRAGWSFGRAAVFGNLAAVAFAVPILALHAWRPEQGLAVLAAALAGSLALARQRPGLAAVALPVFVVSLGLYLPQSGGTPAAIFDRLLSLALAVAWGVGVHAVLRPAATAGARLSPA